MRDKNSVGVGVQSTQAGHGAAYYAVRHIYDHSPGRSWQRLNGALADALGSAIAAHLPFAEDDFAALMRDMSGSYWMGNSEGSVCGERFYTMAVRVGNTPACISFEKYAKRPAAVWSEDVKTPSRLAIGSTLTWDGLKVTVTNMKADHFVVCAYEQQPHYAEDIGEGSIVWFGAAYRTVKMFKRQDDDLLLHLSESIPDPSRKLSRIFKIKYVELIARRKGYEARRKQALRAIEAAETPAALEELRGQIHADRSQYRHFDIEAFGEAFETRRRSFSQELLDSEEVARLNRWVAGDQVPALFRTVRLRVNGNCVETSTGHSVSLESAKKVLPLVLQCREKPARLIGKTVDCFEIRGANTAHLQIGCTPIPWTEVDRIAPEVMNQHIEVVHAR